MKTPTAGGSGVYLLKAIEKNIYKTYDEPLKGKTILHFPPHHIFSNLSKVRVRQKLYGFEKNLYRVRELYITINASPKKRTTLIFTPTLWFMDHNIIYYVSKRGIDEKTVIWHYWFLLIKARHDAEKFSAQRFHFSHFKASNKTLVKFTKDFSSVNGQLSALHVTWLRFQT